MSFEKVSIFHIFSFAGHIIPPQRMPDMKTAEGAMAKQGFVFRQFSLVPLCKGRRGCCGTERMSKNRFRAAPKGRMDSDSGIPRPRRRSAKSCRLTCEARCGRVVQPSGPQRSSCKSTDLMAFRGARRRVFAP